MPSTADLKRVVAALQAAVVPAELGGGSLWELISDALKESLAREPLAADATDATVRETCNRVTDVGVAVAAIMRWPMASAVRTAQPTERKDETAIR